MSEHCVIEERESDYNKKVEKQIPSNNFEVKANATMNICSLISTAALLLALSTPSCEAFVQNAQIFHTIARSSTDLNASNHWMDYLKFNGATPDFDVIEKTKMYTNEPGYRSFTLREIPTEYYSDEYIFRGPIVGPINRKDLVETNTVFGLDKAFPDLDREAFGYCVDPENPFRVMFFERWKATHTGEVKLDPGLSAPATGKQSISPVMPFSIVWTPEGKIIYEHLTTALDRFEGNTNGKVAVFGLLETAGLSLPSGVGDPIMSAMQKINRQFNSPAQVFSKAEDVPNWWKSKAVGAEKNDV